MARALRSGLRASARPPLAVSPQCPTGTSQRLEVLADPLPLARAERRGGRRFNGEPLSRIEIFEMEESEYLKRTKVDIYEISDVI